MASFTALETIPEESNSDLKPIKRVQHITNRKTLQQRANSIRIGDAALQKCAVKDARFLSLMDKLTPTRKQSLFNIENSLISS